VLITIAASSTALAKGRIGNFESREKAARKACLTGDYHRGVEILADLFVDSEDITYIFNQGRCYQQNHRWQEALDRFSEYQRKSSKLPETDKAEVEAHIADCKAHLPAQPAGAQPAAT
jgi:hypothetical protein